MGSLPNAPIGRDQLQSFLRPRVGDSELARADSPPEVPAEEHRQDGKQNRAVERWNGGRVGHGEVTYRLRWRDMLVDGAGS